MRKIFIAVVAVGICFGVTDVEAKNELRTYTCLQIKNKADQSLDNHKMHHSVYVDELGSKGVESPRVKISKGHMIAYLEFASQWATIYTAFCKK